MMSFVDGLSASRLGGMNQCGHGESGLLLI